MIRLFELKDMGILTSSTFRRNRTKDCPLPTEEVMKKNRSRGDFEYQTEQNTGLHIVRWLDNKCVTLGPTYVGDDVKGTVKRWNTPQKNIVEEYNQSMGGVGVGLHDMIIA